MHWSGTISTPGCSWCNFDNFVMGPGLSRNRNESLVSPTDLLLTAGLGLKHPKTWSSTRTITSSGAFRVRRGDLSSSLSNPSRDARNVVMPTVKRLHPVHSSKVLSCSSLSPRRCEKLKCLLVARLSSNGPVGPCSESFIASLTCSSPSSAGVKSPGDNLICPCLSTNTASSVASNEVRPLNHSLPSTSSGALKVAPSCSKHFVRFRKSKKRSGPLPKMRPES
mmetsp:Transcript_1108/g.3459  ORF Transcript_1108/g.3459 Transcript_1108/m.3459 type:complete len:223 (-) Transcript_1108:3555-4223(-)